MKMCLIRTILRVFCAVYFILDLASCSSNKNIPYFKNIPLSEYSKIEQAPYTEPKIMADDLLDISIQTTDPSAVSAIRSGAIDAKVYSPNASQQTSGYLVDKNGEVEIPVLGKIKITNLTTYMARDTIRKIAQQYFKDPTVQVRFVNFRISVLGEVAKPSSYTVPNEKINILDAIALAGDLTLYGKRENVLLIRETDKGKEMIRFNLNDSKIFRSPYYYLRQNDIIYVEPSKSIIAKTDSGRLSTIAVVASVLSTITLIIIRVF